MIEFPKKQKIVRLSISIRPDLISWVRDTAKANDVSMSAVVEAALYRMREQDISNKMIEGLLEDR